jgi:hypothetical protein
MNPEQLYKTNKPEALRMIAESVYHMADFYSLTRNDSYGNITCEISLCDEPLTIYDPTADTPEGKAQAWDLLKAYLAYDRKLSKGDELKNFQTMMDDAKTRQFNIMMILTDDNEQDALCLEYLKLIMGGDTDG